MEQRTNTAARRVGGSRVLGCGRRSHRAGERVVVQEGRPPRAGDLVLVLRGGEPSIDDYPIVDEGEPGVWLVGVIGRIEHP